MLNPHKILFISDLHLSARSTHLNRLFKTFIRDHAHDASQVYLLGDIFDTWIGDDDLTPFTREIAQQLQGLAQRGTRVFFMPGNRDFLLKETYCQLAGMQLLPDPCIVTFDGINYLLTHGDSLCTDDLDYQHYRNKVRDPVFIKKILKKPLWLRRLFAQYLRWRSRHYLAKMPHTSHTILDTNLSSVRALMQQYQVKYLIHGHTHRPSVHLFDLDQHGWSSRYVLSDWGEKGNFLCLEQKKLHLLYFDDRSYFL